MFALVDQDNQLVFVLNFGEKKKIRARMTKC